MFGLEIHPYGLILGFACIVGWELVKKVAQKYSVAFASISNQLLGIFVVGLISARVWHVITDWSLYSDAPISALYVWNGGLSIIGGILGGCLAGFVFSLLKAREKKKTLLRSMTNFFVLTDVLVHAVPISQAIGRIGNFINQELYGLPTNLPWGIPIDPSHRLVSVQSFTHFHPLFLYEMFLNICISAFLWNKRWQLGAGKAIASYLLLYGLGRVCLDFLRIDRGDHVWFGLSLNQYVLLILALVSLGFLVVKNYQLKSTKTGK
ncbi:prolipoprotein diacylglyceryl transferase [Candidatus Woesebacteria bacterium]|nr:prolipoprotein diacylglyceryl transferase [Candidatus Woesebacteria bacterium]